MRRIWLHIGSHKTGSTSLQRALAADENAACLQGWTDLGARLAKDTNLVKTLGAGNKFQTRLQLDVLDGQIPDEGNCILSTEGLFWIDDAGQIAELRAFLSTHFDDIQIVAYLRRQDSLALAHRKQVIHRLPAKRFYGVQVQALPEYRPHMTRYFGYASKLRKWEQVFGAANIHVRRFQPKDLKNGDTVADFFDLAGLGTPAPLPHVNTSLSHSQTLAGLWLASRGHSPRQHMSVLRNLDNDGPLRPSRADAEAFLGHFAAENAELARKYAPDGPDSYFDMDMSRYGDESTDSLDESVLLALERKIMARTAKADQKQKNKQRAE
jgi:hypothetical protein